jgi:hypothetical protein
MVSVTRINAAAVIISYARGQYPSAGNWSVDRQLVMAVPPGQSGTVLVHVPHEFSVMVSSGVMPEVDSVVFGPVLEVEPMENVSKSAKNGDFGDANLELGTPIWGRQFATRRKLGDANFSESQNLG